MSGGNITIQSSVAQSGQAARSVTKSKRTADNNSSVSKTLEQTETTETEKIRDSAEHKQQNDQRAEDNHKQNSDSENQQTSDCGILVDTKG